jgi:NarL family two-component system response regulator YdfI
MIRGLRAGARGYLLKDTDRETLLNTIRAAARGETLLKPEIMARVLSHAGSASAPKSAKTSGATDLTEREIQVLRLIVRGAQNKEIAAQLNITERTVKAHLASIFNRLGVNSRTEAAAVAVRMGLVPRE